MDLRIRTIGVSIAVAAAIATAAAPALAQTPDEAMRERPESLALEREGPGGVFDLSAYIGWLAPVSDLTDDPSSFATIVNPSVGFGLDGTLWFDEGSFGLSGQGYWTHTELDLRATDFEGATPSDLGSVDYLSFTANAVYRLHVTRAASTVQPFFWAGGGARYLSIAGIASPEAESSWDPLGNLGMGAYVKLIGGVNLRADLRWMLSPYTSPSTDETRLQSDFLITVGAGWRFH